MHQLFHLEPQFYNKEWQMVSFPTYACAQTEMFWMDIDIPYILVFS